MPPCTDLDAHSLQVVETVHEPLDVPSMPQLSLSDIMLKLCTIRVVIRRIAIGEPIQHDGITGHPPVGGRGVEGMVLP